MTWPLLALMVRFVPSIFSTVPRILTGGLAGAWAKATADTAAISNAAMVRNMGSPRGVNEGANAGSARLIPFIPNASSGMIPASRPCRFKPSLQGIVRIVQRAPHVGDGTAVEAQALLRLPEVAADDVHEGIDSHLHAGLERVEVVHGDHARVHVPLVLARALVARLDVRRGHVILAEDTHVELRILVADRGVRVEAQRLVMADRPAHLLGNVGLHHLRAPPAVIGLHDIENEVVQEASEHGFLGFALLERVVRALQNVVADARRPAKPDEIDERRALGQSRERRQLRALPARARSA